MEESHSIFIATDELQSSPLIRNYSRMFDISLILGEVRLISIMLPFRGTDDELKKTLIHFNPDLMEILHASIYPNVNGKSAMLTLTIEPRDIGVTAISVSTIEKQSTPAATYVPHFIKNKPIS